MKINRIEKVKAEIEVLDGSFNMPRDMIVSNCITFIEDNVGNRKMIQSLPHTTEMFKPEIVKIYVGGAEIRTTKFTKLNEEDKSNMFPFPIEGGVQELSKEMKIGLSKVLPEEVQNGLRNALDDETYEWSGDKKLRKLANHIDSREGTCKLCSDEIYSICTKSLFDILRNKVTYIN